MDMNEVREYSRYSLEELVQIIRGQQDRIEELEQELRGKAIRTENS